MPKRDPHEVLDVEPGASPVAIKAAWRRLARRHHPDLTGDDPAASRAATRRMAEINDAYEALTRGDAGNGRRAARAGATEDTGAAAPPPRARGGGPPRPRPTRPVTGRLDTSDTFRPRNSTTAAGRRAAPARGHPPRPREVDREPPRASQPTGPLERGRVHRFRAPPLPSLDDARSVELEFGKFRGHTLGEVAAFEPSYVDWLAKTITRDRDLVAAARVIRDDLDRRGVRRRERVSAAPGRSA
jgi:hypothetical protein